MTEQAKIEYSHSPNEERARRWRLILGGGEADGTAAELKGEDIGMDEALSDLYDAEERKGGLKASNPDIARWLGDIRKYFPQSAARMMQQDALDRLKLRKLLLQPELLAEIEPDIHLVATLLSLNKVMPAQTRETAKLVVRQVVEELQRRLQLKMEAAVRGSLNRAERTRRPRYKEINWGRTVHVNLKHYQPKYNTVVPETLVGYGRKRASLRDIILCIDQSGSMASSVVYASIFGATLASLTAVSTRMIVFDTSVVDLTEQLHDPVDLLFGTRLGGGTDINRALGYCQQTVTRPQDTILVLISDLYEGGNKESMMQRAAELVASGVQVIALLALNDEGAPSFDRATAAHFAELGIPTFACTPDLFPDMMAAAIHRQDVGHWAGKQGLT